jgi:2',3'-cyclic-nucleotide 2'-phosphodiesterase (5'-nucleotidase family)
MGLNDDVTKGSKRVAANVPGLALVVDGHTHTKVEEPVTVYGGFEKDREHLNTAVRPNTMGMSAAAAPSSR